MATIDGDALRNARAAEREGRREPITYTLAERTFTFPPEMPIGVVLATVEIAERGGRLSFVAKGLESAFGAEQWASYLEVAPTAEDLYALWNALLDAYATSEGESSSSPASSAPGGESSKPSSSGSTTSTRGKSSRPVASAVSAA